MKDIERDAFQESKEEAGDIEQKDDVPTIDRIDESRGNETYSSSNRGDLEKGESGEVTVDKEGNSDVEDDQERTQTTAKDDQELQNIETMKTTFSTHVKGADGHHYQQDFPKMSMTKTVTVILITATAMALTISSVQGMTIALPSVGEDLGINDSDLQWLVSSYSVTFGCFLLLFGRLADLWGHKLFFLLGTGFFAIFSLAGGFVHSAVAMNFMRAFQGIGSAALIPAGLGVLGRSFPPGPTKSMAFAIFSAGAPTGAGLGLLIGGVITQYAAAKWRAYFYVTAALAAVVLILGAVFIPSLPVLQGPGSDRSVDWIGAFLITASLVLLTFALADGETAPNGWATPYIPTFLALSVIGIVIFVLWELYVEKKLKKPPLMRVGIWTQGRFAVVQLAALFSWMCFSSFSFFGTLYFQEYLHLNPVLTTVRFIPMCITGILLNFVVGLTVARISANILMTIGAIGLSLSVMLFAIQRVEAEYWTFQFPAMILSVFGADILFPCATLYGSKVVGAHEQALAGGIVNTNLQVGTGIGLAILTIIEDKVTNKEAKKLGVVINDAQDNIPPAARLKGLRAAFWGAFAFGMVTAAIAALLLYDIGKVGDKKQASIKAPSILSGKRSKSKVSLNGTVSDGGRMDQHPDVSGTEAPQARSPGGRPGSAAREEDDQEDQTIVVDREGS